MQTVIDRIRGLSAFDRQDRAESRKTRAIIIGALSLVGLWCWLEHRSLRAQQQTYDSLRVQTGQMATDAGIIAALSNAPRVATERERPNDELLDQVRSALIKSNLPEENWIGNDPSNAVRVPKSPYKSLSTRLSFDDVTLEQLIRFCHALVEDDSSLNVASLKVTAPRSTNHSGWDAEIVVTYLIYSPYRSASSRMSRP